MSQDSCRACQYAAPVPPVDAAAHSPRSIAMVPDVFRMYSVTRSLVLVCAAMHTISDQQPREQMP